MSPLSIGEGTGGSVAPGAADDTWAWNNAALSLLADDIFVLVFAGSDAASGFGSTMYDSSPPSGVPDTFETTDTARMRYGVGRSLVSGGTGNIINLEIWQVRISATHTAGSLSGSAFWLRQTGASASTTPNDTFGWWRAYRIRGFDPDDVLEINSNLVGGRFTSPANPDSLSASLTRTSGSEAIAWAMAWQVDHGNDPPANFTGISSADSFDDFEADYVSATRGDSGSNGIGFARGELDGSDTDALFTADGSSPIGGYWVEALLEFVAVPPTLHGLSTYIGIKYAEAPQ